MNLEDIFFKVEDITDPSWIGILDEYLDVIKLEDEQFMEALMEKKDDMIISWEQPWYQKMASLTRPLKEINDDKFEKFKTDTICKEESDKIHENWINFHRLFNIPDKPICLARWKNKDKSRNPNSSEEYIRRFVISFLAQGLERTLNQVYKHVLVRYASTAKGNYTKWEENIMNICLYYRPNIAVPYLSAILGREPRGIYKKLQQISDGKSEVKRVKWTLSLASTLVNLLMKYSGETLENLKCKRFDKTVWLNIEKDMDCHYISLQKFWYNSLHVQLFVKSDVKLKKITKKAFKRIRSYPYKVWSDIRWKEITKHFQDGYTHNFLYNICYNFAKTKRQYNKLPLEDVIDYSLQKARASQNKRLRTLILNENCELEIITYRNKIENN